MIEITNQENRPTEPKPQQQGLQKEQHMDDVTRQPQKRSWDRPQGASFEQWMKSRVARVAERAYDWNALKFQADFDPKYRRAQKRFIGTGGTGVAHDSNVIPAEHFTLSNMVLPAGAEGPMHLHVDAEEVFFVLRGKIKVMVEKDGEYWEAVLGERACISVPPGVYRGEANVGEEDAVMMVMIGSPKPVTPTYPPEHPLTKVKRG
jgi:quercetin dioxygenase-like cupin family protein